MFRYQATTFGDTDYDHGADATVGIECPNGVHAIEVAYHQPSLTDGLAMAFSPISSAGQALLDAGSYACSATAEVRVLDADLEGQTQVLVTVASDTEPTPLQVSLTPAGDPRIFAGSFVIAQGAPVPDGILQVAPGDTVTLRYQDANPPAERTATALVDCSPPVISGLEAVDVGATTVRVRWTTDEPATSWAQASPGGAVASDPRLVTDHDLLLAGLAPCTTHTVQAASVDAPGNSGSAGPTPPFATLDLVVALDDDVESGNTDWTVDTAIGGGTNWSIVVDGSPNHSWSSSDADAVKDDRLVAGPFTLGAGTTTLSFDHHYGFESSWDGGVIEVSTDGWSWQDVTAAGGVFVAGGYSGELNSSGNPLGGRQVWTGTGSGTVEVDLSVLSGSSLWFRFRLGCDGSVPANGWWVDDIQLVTTTACSGPLFADGFESGTTAAWSSVVP